MMWWSVCTFLLISLRSMSIWTIFAFWAKVAGLSATRSEKRQPTAISRSQASTAMFDACEPCIPIMPVVSGLRPRKPPAPMTVMATGESMRFASASNSWCARARTTPPPQMSSGFFDAAIISTNLSMSRWSGSGALKFWLERFISLPKRPDVPCAERGSGS